METTDINKNGSFVFDVFYRFGDFEVDLANRICSRRGKTIPITGKAYDVLVAFLENPGRLLSKDELLSRVWNEEFVEEGNVARNVSTLRKLLGDTGRQHKFLVTVPGHGYRFIADLQRSDTSTRLTGLDHAEAETGEDSVVSYGRTPAIEPHGSLYEVRELTRERPWLVFLGAACLIVIALLSFRQWGLKPLQRELLTFDRVHEKRLTQDGNVYQPLISPDGQYLAFVKLRGNERALCVRQLATGSDVELVPPGTHVSFWGTAFAPDDQFLYYILREGGADHGGIFRVPLFGGAKRKIAEMASGGLTVSPDGKRVVFERIDRQAGTSSIIVADSDGNDPRVIATAVLDSMFYSVDWSPDGNSLIYSFKTHDAEKDRWYLAEIPSGGGVETRIGESSDSPILTAKWMPDRSGLIVSAVDPATRQPQLYSVSYPDGVRRRLTNGRNSFSGFSTTADGRSIVITQMSSDRQIWDLSEGSTNAPGPVSSGNERHFDNVAWARDQFIVFDEDENGTFDNYNIYRMRPDGSEVQSLTTGSGNNSNPSVSPNGQTIAFVSGRTGNRQIWRMNIEGRDQIQLTDLPYDILRPVISPNGETIYFSVMVAGKCRIWQVPTNGGKPYQVVDGDVYRWALAPDGDHIAYSAFDDRIRAVRTHIYSLSQMNEEKIFEIAPETCMDWSNDGIYFDTVDDGSQNVWRQPLDGSPAKTVTSFDTQQVFRFAWEPNGKNLACIRHTTTFDAVELRFD